MVEIVFTGYISDLVGGQQQANYPICGIEHQKFTTKIQLYCFQICD